MICPDTDHSNCPGVFGAFGCFFPPPRIIEFFRTAGEKNSSNCAYVFQHTNAETDDWGLREMCLSLKIGRWNLSCMTPIQYQRLMNKLLLMASSLL